MSNSKPLTPFVFDVLCYLNRDQLERFSIVCRSLKNIIERYFHTKPHRIFDQFCICKGLYVLVHNKVRWHLNRDDYTVQQFLGNPKYGATCETGIKLYSFDEMRPYLGTNIRVKYMYIDVAPSVYTPDHIAEMESISYLWQDGNISVWHIDGYGKRIVAEDFLPILNSPTILQCRNLVMINTDFSFKDYKMLYSVKVIEINRIAGDIDPNHWLDFLEQPGVKPLVTLLDFQRAFVDTILDSLSKAFSSSAVPNEFKIVFAKYNTHYHKVPLTEFCETNKTSEEKLELKKGVPIEYQHRTETRFGYYTLERSRI